AAWCRWHAWRSPRPDRPPANRSPRSPPSTTGTAHPSRRDSGGDHRAAEDGGAGEGVGGGWAGVVDHVLGHEDQLVERHGAEARRGARYLEVAGPLSRGEHPLQLVELLA